MHGEEIANSKTKSARLRQPGWNKKHETLITHHKGQKNLSNKSMGKEHREITSHSCY
jgi:hypothetical protein